MAKLKKRKLPKRTAPKESAFDYPVAHRGRTRKMTSEEIRDKAIKAANEAIDKYIGQLR